MAERDPASRTNSRKCAPLPQPRRSGGFPQNVVRRVVARGAGDFAGRMGAAAAEIEIGDCPAPL